MQQPKVIFLDAVGTLFGVRGNVGKVYGEIAHQFGVEVSAKQLDRAFYEAFQAAGTPAFVGADLKVVAEKEFDWWRAIAVATFQQVGAIEQFTDFSAFFAALYAHFATATPWFLYDDVLPALERWQQQGVQLGILSNFDSRLYAVLDALKLSPFFSSVTISTRTGAAKPDPQIFQVALQKHLCLPEFAWHIGDRLDEDYQAACTVGMRGIWLNRKK
jgi:putative hydrolase of the HAD superfamily